MSGSEESVRTLVTALQEGDLELAATRMSDDFLWRGFAARDLKKNETLSIQSELDAAITGFDYQLSDLQADGNTVRGLVAISGTHTQDLNLPLFGLPDMPVTGLDIRLPQVPISFRVQGEHVTLMEMTVVPGGGLSGLIQQIGAELPPEPVVDANEG